MSAKNPITKKEVFLDFPSALIILRDRGVKKTLGSVSEEGGFSRVALGKWQKKAPAVVGLIYHFLKENELTFEDLVKEVANH